MPETTLPEFGLFAVDAPTRTVRGIVIPYNEASKVSVTKHPPITFRPGDVRIPRDPSVVILNKHHDRYDPIGNGSRFDATDSRGVFAEYKIAETDEGDAWLANNEGLVRLSPELKDITKHPDGTFTATLTGSGLVTMGAWESAGLFAVDDEVTTAVDASTSTISSDLTPTTTTTTQKGAAMPETIVPDGVTPTPTPTPAPAPRLTPNGLFAALAAKFGMEGDTTALAAYAPLEASRGMFAAYAPLQDITATAAAATMPAQLIGEVYGRRAFAQRIIPLFDHADLTSLNISGWGWTTPPEVGPWAGDKAAIPSNATAFGPVNGVAERIAGGHDIDRALRDFGNAQFWDSYFRYMSESYAKQADAKVRAKVLAAATTVAPGAVAAGQDAGTVAIVDGALAVIDAGYLPTFAIVSSAIFRSMLLTPKDKVLEFLNSSLGLEEGQLAGFRFIPDSTLAAKRVIVGTKSAGTVYELPGSPVRVEGIDVAHGGIDPALFGYVGWVTNDPKGLASVTTA